MLGSAAVFWWSLALSTVAFLLPLGEPMKGSAQLFETWSGVPVDKLAHALVFTVLVVLGGRARRAGARDRVAPGMGGIVAGLLVYAVAIEACQHVVPWRSFEIRDVVADGLGIALGTLLTIATRRHRRDSPLEP